MGLITTDPRAAANSVGDATGSERAEEQGSINIDVSNETMIEYINETGGIAGRQVEPVYYLNESGIESEIRRRNARAACALWTEDEPVFAFSAHALNQEDTLECAARSKTPMVAWEYQAYPSRERFESMSQYWYGPHHFVADRRERAMANFLIDHRFFSEGAKVAIMIEDRPGIREGVENGMKPILAAEGFEDPLEIVYPDPLESPWANYVLQLQSAGVTHVVFSAGTFAYFPVMFMQRAAEDQEYRPRWAIGSDNTSKSGAIYDAPGAQLANTVGMGWSPYGDVQDFSSQSSNAEICEELMVEAGEPPNLGSGYRACEFLFFLRAALEHADELSPSGLAEGVSRLGDEFESAMTHGGATHFGPDRHDGVAFVRLFAFDSGAQQFTYRTPLEPVPDHEASDS